MEPTVSPTPVPETAPVQKTSYGALVALVVIVLAIAGGAMYFLNTRITDSAISADPSGLTEQSDSTDAAAIESDLSAESPDDFDKDIDEAFAELDASFSE